MGRRHPGSSPPILWTNGSRVADPHLSRRSRGSASCAIKSPRVKDRRHGRRRPTGPAIQKERVGRAHPLSCPFNGSVDETARQSPKARATWSLGRAPMTRATSLPWSKRTTHGMLMIP